MDDEKNLFYNDDGILLYTVNQAADLLECTPLTIKNRIKKGVYPHFERQKINGIEKIMIPETDLKQPIEKKYSEVATSNKKIFDLLGHIGEELEKVNQKNDDLIEQNHKSQEEIESLKKLIVDQSQHLKKLENQLQELNNKEEKGFLSKIFKKK